VAAVEEGRGIYDNIRKTLQYLLAGNAGELLLMTVAILAGLPAPLLPIHLLWINLVTDGFPALCLAAERIDPGVMQRSPRPTRAPITDRAFLATLLWTGLLTAAVATGVFLWALDRQGLEAARSEAFTVLVFSELLRSFGVRSDTPVWRQDPRGNKMLLAVVLLSLGLQFMILQGGILGRFLSTEPLPWAQALLMLLISTIPLAVLEIRKVLQAAPMPR
jgi:Ca2+-transporting ATPase